MELRILPTYPALCRAVANRIADQIRQKPAALVCLASGHSPLGVFECLVADVQQGNLDISGCTFVGLDEWLGMNGTDPGSCRHMMDESFFLPLQIPAAQIAFFDGKATNPDAEVQRINELIDRQGGLDVMLVGIGTNGHIAMNEPGTPFQTRAHISTLAEETKTVGQKYFSSATPLDKGITLGLHHFATAGLPLLMANGSRKAPILKRLFEEDVSEQLPASIVHQVPRAVVMVDQEAAAQMPSVTAIH
ncbi:MAG: 6-phosphogluconolactonase [Bacteroidota bacterium]